MEPAAAHALASAFLAGPWQEELLLRRAAGVLRPRPAGLRTVVRGVLAAHPRPPRDAPRALAALVGRLLREEAARHPARGGPGGPRAAARVVRERPFAPAPGRLRFGQPALAGAAELAALLELSAGTLAWLADVRSLERTAPEERLRNYRYGWLARTGAAPPRVVERPKARLKAAQRIVLRELLDRIPAHPAAHGFVPGRSAATHAALHAGRRVVLRVDLEDFFAQVSAGRIWATFRAAGHPEAVAHTLTGLCTNVVPAREWAAVPRPATLAAITAHHRLGRRLATPHLPQGAPTSPALANLVAHRLDRRLSGLARSLGATYSRYADDLVLSGDRELERRLPAARAALVAIAADEGWVLHPGKSQLMPRAGRQRVCGLVVNVAPNVAREEQDRLRAVLHDAATHGPAHANRAGLPHFRAHLAGRVAWVASVNPRRGARLARQLAAIDWAA